MTIILGLLGPAGSGKSTSATFLVENYGAKRYALATPLKQIAQRTLDFTDAQMFGTQEQKETIDPRYGFTPRWFLQRLGTQGVRDVLGVDFWTRECLRKIASDADMQSLSDDCRERSNGEFIAVIDDVRFLNEVSRIRNYDSRVYSGQPDSRFVNERGLILRLENPYRASNADASHQSEAEWSRAPYDFLVKPELPVLLDEDGNPREPTWEESIAELYRNLDRVCASLGIPAVKNQATSPGMVPA